MTCSVAEEGTWELLVKNWDQFVFHRVTPVIYVLWLYWVYFLKNCFSFFYLLISYHLQLIPPIKSIIHDILPFFFRLKQAMLRVLAVPTHDGTRAFILQGPMLTLGDAWKRTQQNLNWTTEKDSLFSFDRLLYIQGRTNFEKANTEAFCGLRYIFGYIWYTESCLTYYSKVKLRT
jgi:hypothetical protein